MCIAVSKMLLYSYFLSARVKLVCFNSLLAGVYANIAETLPGTPTLL